MTKKTETKPITRNATNYARELGYTGSKRVIVQDGMVISHNNVEWHIFCASLTTPEALKE